MYDISRALFILYLLIFGNYLQDLLGCRVQKLLSKNTLFKHFIAFFTIYFFIIFSDMEVLDDTPSKTLLYTILLYIWFLFTLKNNIICYFMILFLIFLIFLIEREKRHSILKNNKKKQLKLELAIKIITLFAIIITIIGFILYFFEKKNKFKNKKNYLKFILGKNYC